jgi:hypothetical protein
VVQGLWNEADVSKTKRLGHTARIKALEDDLRKLRAQLPKEIHHAVRGELRVEMHDHEARCDHEPHGGHFLPETVMDALAVKPLDLLKPSETDAARIKWLADSYLVPPRYDGREA